jgi:hypothetical protein
VCSKLTAPALRLTFRQKRWSGEFNGKLPQGFFAKLIKTGSIEICSISSTRSNPLATVFVGASVGTLAMITPPSLCNSNPYRPERSPFLLRSMRVELGAIGALFVIAHAQEVERRDLDEPVATGAGTGGWRRQAA